MLTELLISLIVALFIFGVALAVWGKRGRRLDRHRLCSKCRYDLTGSPKEEVANCPECGAELSRHRAVKIGNRQPRRAIFWAGVLFVAASLGGGLSIGAPAARSSNWYLLLPFSMVLEAANDVHDPGRAAAGQEVLLDRHRKGALSDEQYESVVDIALARQADRSLPWDYFWGDIVEIARYEGRVTDAEWRHFLTEACQWELFIQPTLREGEDIVYEFRLVGAQHTATPRRINTRYVTYEGDDAAVFEFEGTTSEGRFFNETVTHTYVSGGPPPTRIRTTWYPEIRIPAGQYTCSVSISWYVYDAAFGITDQRDMPRVSHTGRPTTRTDRITYQASFEILSRDEPEYLGSH